MKSKRVGIPEPKTRIAALNLSAYHISQTEIIKRRKENLMKNVSDTKKKLLQLEDVLKEYERHLEELESSDKVNSKLLEQIKLQWELTESEILCTRSELIRKQITNLRKLNSLQEGVDNLR